MNSTSCRKVKMPSHSQEVNIDVNSNESSQKTETNEGRIEECDSMGSDQLPAALAGLSADQKLAYAMRDIRGSPSTVLSETDPTSPLLQQIPYIDEQVDTWIVAESDVEQNCSTEMTLNNAVCRLKRWRKASRKLRGPRNVDNLGAGESTLAGRLRSLTVVGGMSVSASELSLTPPPAATAPSSPGFLLVPSLADQISPEYFGSSPECCADIESKSNVDAPAPAPGPRYKLATQGSLRISGDQHSRTMVDKLLATKFLRKWDTHTLCLQEDAIVSKTPSGIMERPLSYSCMQEVYCISRWDAASKYCLTIVMAQGSLLLRANTAYSRDQWFHSIIWKRNMLRYRTLLTKANRKEVVLKELKNMVDFVMTTPLQDESVTRAPIQILTKLLSEEKDSPDWEDWAESATNVAAPMLAERCSGETLCGLLARLCRQQPRAVPLIPALAPPVRRVLTRNVDFTRAPEARRLVRDYISGLSAHNSGPLLVRRFVEVTHGPSAVCPRPRAAPNLAAVALAALNDFYRDVPLPHVCSDQEDEVLCFAGILAHMAEYEDWLVVVGGVLQPVPLCANAMACPYVAKKLSIVLGALARDTRCAAHGSVAPARGARLYPPSWLRVAAPSDPLLALPHQHLCQLWGDMLESLIKCCCNRKSFLQSMSKQLPDFLLVALTEHPAALEALCLMLEWDIASGEQTQLEIIAALQGTNLGQKYYRDLCERQKNLVTLQSEGGPRRLALPVRATDADVAALLETGALGNLECLSLAFTSVTSACAHHLIKLPSLRYLNLWATKFDDSGVQLIAEHLPRLQVLNLCETPVSDKGIEALSALSSLKRLNLNSTKLSATAFEVLRQRLPQLQEYDVRYTEAW